MGAAAVMANTVLLQRPEMPAMANALLAIEAGEEKHTLQE